MVLQCGLTGTSIPATTTVMRVCKPKNMDADKGVPHPAAFEFSTDDKRQTPRKLSVFEDQLTTPLQAVGFITTTNQGAVILYLRSEPTPNWWTKS
jgi:hypothetical protein